MLLQPLLAGAVPFISFFPALVIASIGGGLRAGVICLAGGLITVWFHPPPTGATLWIALVFAVSGGVVAFVSSSVADTVRQLRTSREGLARAQDELHTLVRELAHRNRNSLAVMRSIVSQSARSVATASEAETLINARIDALARAQSIVAARDGQAAALDDIVAAALEPFDVTAFSLTAVPAVEVAPEVAVSLGLLLHELATNAVKYGALSAPAGRVELGCRIDAGWGELCWREMGGPQVTAPRRRGFGSRLVDLSFSAQGGFAKRRFEADGVACDLRFPLAGTPGQPAKAAEPTPGAPQLIPSG